jgi:hypothetical protein
MPFKINAEKDLTFLRDGITDMLVSRLTWEDKVSVVGREETRKALEGFTGTLNEEQAREIGSRLNADYVLFGSLTMLGNSVSLDAKLVASKGSRPAMAFFEQSQGMDAVIPGVNRFATEINEKVFGRGQAIASRPGAAPKGEPSVPESRMHPEKLFQQGWSEGEEGKAPEHSLNPAFIDVRSERAASQHRFWKSQNIPELITGIAVDDVDKDGRKETVLASANTVFIYRLEKGRFLKIQDLNQGGREQIIGVDVADINGNGYPEIFVTALNPLGNRVESFVLEYNGQVYTRIVHKSPYFFRVSELPDRGKILYGQDLTASGPFGGRIYEMDFQGSDYLPGKRVLSSDLVNVIGFSVGNVLNDGDETAVAYSSGDYIQILGIPSGNVKWSGSEKYGGNMLAFSMALTEPGQMHNPKYFPMRILVADLDGDGKSEVIAAKNYEVAGGRLEQFRNYTDAHIESFSWDGLGLASNWKTRKISGRISDFTIADFDNDGEDEMVAAVVSKEGSIIGTEPKSAVIAYDLKK